MKTTPKTFYEFIQKSAGLNDFRIVINGQLCSFMYEHIDHHCDSKNFEHSFFIRGKLLPEGELNYVNVGPTAIRMGSLELPCEILGCTFDYDTAFDRAINGRMMSIPHTQHINISICIQYSSYAYELGGIEDASGEIPEAIKHIIEIQEDPKKKTFFDWIDLE